LAQRLNGKVCGTKPVLLRNMPPFMNVEHSGIGVRLDLSPIAVPMPLIATHVVGTIRNRASTRAM
jgi:hypothetical protein